PPATPPTPRPPKPLAGRSRKLPCSPSPPIPPCALSATPTCAATREGSRQNRQSPDPFPPTPARTPSVAGFPDRSPQPALAPPATLRWLSPSPTRPPHLAAPPYGIHPSEHHRPGWPTCGFWPGGELLEPHQCSIAFLEPCCFRGIRTNEDRALTAVVFSHSISPTLPHAKSHTIQSGLRPVAVLPSAFRSAFDRDLRLKGAGTLEIDLDRGVEEELKRLILSLTPWVLTSGAFSSRCHLHEYC